MSLFGCSKGVKRAVKKLLQGQQEIKELIMGVKEDFATFVADVNAVTNSIGEALIEIQADIERLMAANITTPPEVVAGMEEIKAKLATLSSTSTAIAALDNPVVPPVEEPPL